MKNTLDQNLILAEKLLSRNYVKTNMGKFSNIYPFTTENISGYIDQFNIKNKDMLITGSSFDQAINASLYSPSSITLNDINVFTKYYAYLKIAALQILTKEEFLEFFRYRDYPVIFKNNKDVFKKDIFNKIKDILRLLDYESYLFWDELFSNYNPLKIRDNLFSMDEDRTSILTTSNKYLLDDDTYNKAKKFILNTEILFKNTDIFENNKLFDIIWQSNIGCYLYKNELSKLFKNIKYLKDNGQILLCYLYDTTIYSKYIDTYSPIYDLDFIFEEFKQYDIHLHSFIGTKGIKFKIDNIKDSVLIYKKTLKK